MKKIRVLISGTGPAGLALGILLDKNKYDVTIYEREKQFVSIGFSIILWKTGHDILQKLLEPHAIQNIYPLNRFSIYGGAKIERMETADSTGVGFSIKREALINQLSKQYVHVRGLKTVRFGTYIKDLLYRDNEVIVTSNAGEKQKYDLVIAADGMHSVIRNSNLSIKAISHPYKITYCWIEPGSNLKEEALIGFLENYLYLIQTVDDGALLAYYNRGDVKENTLFIKKLSQMIGQELGGRLVVDESSTCNFQSEMVHVDKAYDRRLVVVGDAFHGHPPTLGMGTSVALEDSWELAKYMNEIPRSIFNDSIEGALSMYSSRRARRIKEVYSTQDLIEKLLITDSKTEVAAIMTLVKNGAWPLIEKVLRNIFTGRIDVEK